MTSSWLKNGLLITVFGVSLSAFAQGGLMNRIDRHARKFFESRYDNPVMEVLVGSFTKVFPTLVFYSVFDEENLVEDPLIPDLWIRTSTLAYFSGHDITKALLEDGIYPRNEKDAISIAREILELQYDGCYALEGPQSFSGDIPMRFNEKIFFPTVIKTSRGYMVGIHIFFPDSRYAEFLSPYCNTIVGYSVDIDESNYSIREERVYLLEESPED